MRLPRKIKKACKKYLVLGAVLNTNVCVVLIINAIKQIKRVRR